MKTKSKLKRKVLSLKKHVEQRQSMTKEQAELMGSARNAALKYEAQAAVWQQHYTAARIALDVLLRFNREHWVLGGKPRFDEAAFDDMLTAEMARAGYDVKAPEGGGVEQLATPVLLGANGAPLVTPVEGAPVDLVREPTVLDKMYLDGQIKDGPKT